MFHARSLSKVLRRFAKAPSGLPRSASVLARTAISTLTEAVRVLQFIPATRTTASELALLLGYHGGASKLLRKFFRATLMVEPKRRG